MALRRVALLRLLLHLLLLHLLRNLGKLHPSMLRRVHSGDERGARLGAAALRVLVVRGDGQAARLLVGPGPSASG